LRYQDHIIVNVLLSWEHGIVTGINPKVDLRLAEKSAAAADMNTRAHS
jgi:hypothetical protein